jgi:hypothetical protein
LCQNCYDPYPHSNSNRRVALAARVARRSTGKER